MLSRKIVRDGSWGAEREGDRNIKIKNAGKKDQWALVDNILSHRKRKLQGRLKQTSCLPEFRIIVERIGCIVGKQSTD